LEVFAAQPTEHAEILPMEHRSSTRWKDTY
jgi:hypothetical protein